MPARKYTYVFFTTLAALSVLVVVFNWLVDPFWYYRDVSVPGFNAVKTKFMNYERHVKPSMVEREQPAVLIFGSSFSEVGFDPMHPALQAIGRTYNFGLAGEAWNAVQCDVKFALKNDTHLREIVLGIHPSGMPETDCRKEISQMEHPEQRAFLFSMDALQSSINTILEQRREKPSHTLEGMYFYSRGKTGTEKRFREVFALTPSCDSKHGVFTADTASAEREALDLGGLQTILHDAVAKGIKVKLVVYPRHALAIERDYRCGMRQTRWDDLEQIVSMVKREAGSSAEVWDFEGYNDICTEPISDAAAKYWQDLYHFNYEFGNEMLDEIYSRKPVTLGTRLTQENIPVRARDEQKARAAFLASHPYFQRQLEQLMRQSSS